MNGCERALYLDIETDSFGQITVVGLYGRDGYKALVKHESLGLIPLREELSRYDLLVTFCGSTFDLPMLRAHFPDLPLDQPHIDLCGVGRQLGYRGGLKAIERRWVSNGPERCKILQGMMRCGSGTAGGINGMRTHGDCCSPTTKPIA